MCRSLFVLFLIVIVSTSVLAGVGVNLYGLSYHPDREETAEYNYNEANWGLGLQYDVMVGERSRLNLEGGGLSDSLRNLNLHGGVSFRHQTWGPLWAGASLFVTGSKSDFNGEPIAGLLPFVSLETKPANLTWIFVPDNGGQHGTGGLLMYATLFPGGRTMPGRGRMSLEGGVRRGLEFGFSPEHGLQDFRGVSFVFRQVDPQLGGFRVGVEYDGLIRDEDTDGTSRMYENDNSQIALSLFWDRLKFQGSSRTVRLMTGAGFHVGHKLSTRYRQINDPNDGIQESWDDEIRWSTGLRATFGLEWRIQEDLVLTANSTLNLSYSRMYLETSRAFESQQTSITSITSHDVTIESAGAFLGVVLYYE